MPETSITKEQLTALINVAESPEMQFSGDKQRNINELLSEGYVKFDGQPSRLTKYRLTMKGERFLTSPETGLN